MMNLTVWPNVIEILWAVRCDLDRKKARNQERWTLIFTDLLTYLLSVGCTIASGIAVCYYSHPERRTPESFEAKDTRRIELNV